MKNGDVLNVALPNNPVYYNYKERSKNPKMIRTIFEEEYFEDFDNGGGVGDDLFSMSKTIIENGKITEMVIAENVSVNEFNKLFSDKGYEKRNDETLVGFYFMKPNGDTIQLIPSFHKKGEILKYAGGGGVGSKTLTRKYLQNKGRNVFTFGYGMPKDAIDKYGTIGGTEYFELPNGDVYKKSKEDSDKFVLIGNKSKMSNGGESDDKYGGQRNKIVTELKGMKGGLNNKAPYVFLKEGYIYVSAENGDNYADYYEYTIDEKLEDLADRYNTYWDWETAGSIVLAPIDTYTDGGEAGEKLISIARAIFNPNEDNGKIATSFGKKTFDGFVEMIKQNDAYDIYYNIWQENAEGKYIATTYGDKTYIGLLEMLKSAKNEDDYAEGGKAGKYSIIVWETEEDRDAGESFVAEILTNKQEALEKAEKMYYKQDFSAIEVIDENDEVILHLSSNEEDEDEYAGGGEAVGGVAKKRRRSASVQYGRSNTAVDKTRPAKPVGYRFTDEKATELNKETYDIPTESEVKKYLGKGIYKENRKRHSDKDRNAKL